jgi:hypothetical protein
VVVMDSCKWSEGRTGEKRVLGLRHI